MDNCLPIGFNHIDLRGVSCPLNFVRCRLALEELPSENFLIVDLDKGEPELMVIPGLRNEGYNVDIISQTSSTITLKIFLSGNV